MIPLAKKAAAPQFKAHYTFDPNKMRITGYSEKYTSQHVRDELSLKIAGSRILGNATTVALTVGAAPLNLWDNTVLSIFPDDMGCLLDTVIGIPLLFVGYGIALVGLGLGLTAGITSLPFLPLFHLARHVLPEMTLAKNRPANQTLDQVYQRLLTLDRDTQHTELRKQDFSLRISLIEYGLAKKWEYRLTHTEGDLPKNMLDLGYALTNGTFSRQGLERFFSKPAMHRRLSLYLALASELNAPRNKQDPFTTEIAFNQHGWRLANP